VSWPAIEYQYPSLVECNGWAHYANTSTATQSTTWTQDSLSDAAGYWASSAVAYKVVGSSGVHGAFAGEIR